MAVRRVTSPDGREWEVRIVRVRLPKWRRSDFDPWEEACGEWRGVLLLLPLALVYWLVISRPDLHRAASADGAVRGTQGLARSTPDLHTGLVRAEGGGLRAGNRACASRARALARNGVVWDVTDTVAGWYSGGLANDGVLLKLVDEQEDYAVGGPALPSSSYADSARRLRLVVWLMT